MATSYIGFALFNLGGIVVYIGTIMLTYGNIMLQIVFSPQFSANGVPFLGLFFVFLQIVLIGQGLRDIRGTGLL